MFESLIIIYLNKLLSKSYNNNIYHMFYTGLKFLKTNFFQGHLTSDFKIILNLLNTEFFLFAHLHIMQLAHHATFNLKLDLIFY